MCKFLYIISDFCSVVSVRQLLQIVCELVTQDSQTRERENKPECHTCQSYLAVIKHILTDCIYFSAVRQRYFQVDTLKKLCANVDSRNIIVFIKDVNFNHRI